MNDRFPGIIVILLITLIWTAGSVWAQDTTQAPAASQPAATEAVQPATTEAAQPAGAEAVQSSAAETSSSDISLAEAALCQDVVDRACVGSGEVFAKEVPRIFCFTRVLGAAPGMKLTHNWYYNGTLKASVELNLGSSDYRTWSYKTMMPEWTGEWMVEIISPDGQPMDSIIFILK